MRRRNLLIHVFRKISLQELSQACARVWCYIAANNLGHLIPVALLQSRIAHYANEGQVGLQNDRRKKDGMKRHEEEDE